MNQEVVGAVHNEAQEDLWIVVCDKCDWSACVESLADLRENYDKYQAMHDQACPGCDGTVELV